jgi:4-alpha-glucanotransferase
MRLERSFGVQLHPTSLPGGRLGPDAFGFVDWLHEAGARWWQVLPLGPPDALGSPYASASAFAGWSGLLADPEASVAATEVRTFRERTRAWLDDWVAYAGDGALADQVRFDREWGALRTYAAERGVRIIGDVPIYVAAGGCDHLTHPELFLPLSEAVAGAPPDRLNREGQLWGNPLYDWRALARSGFRWWLDRMHRALELADVFRMDHFRGFVSYWAVPPGAATARAGRWRRGPGGIVFDAARAELGELPVIAEDLGVITRPVRARASRRAGCPRADPPG